ncbi:MAG: 50S ribosomal protein L17 [Candidatus Latescibacteria bacterium]|nr:50S ribosomal protein L17 [bacterium]MBD3425449.1 50S ribosomal protein L17 [Candidatus Latescibacterota bacterium]
MRHNKDKKSLNRTSSHRKAMLSNMVTSLFRRERIQTSRRKAKEARRVAERMITYAKKGDLASRRQAARVVRDKKVLQKLFDNIGPRFADRDGGYTRVLKMARRSGDNTDMALLELLPKDAKKRGKKQSMKNYRKIEIPEDPVKAREKKMQEEAEEKRKEEEAEAAEKKKEEEEKKAEAEKASEAEEEEAQEAGKEEEAEEAVEEKEEEEDSGGGDETAEEEEEKKEE